MSRSKLEIDNSQIRHDLMRHLGNFHKINFPVNLASHATPRWNRSLDKLISEAEFVINSIDKPEEMIAAVAKMEKQVGQLINTVLRELDKDKTVSKHAAKLDTLSKINQAMVGMNIALSHHVEGIIKQVAENNPEVQLWKDMSHIAENISIDTSMLPPSIKNSDAAKHNIEELLTLGRTMVLLSLLKETGIEQGTRLVNKLAAGLNSKHGLSIGAAFTGTPGECMAVSPSGMNALAKIDREYFDSALPFEQLTKQGVENNTGSGSVLSIPIIMTDDDLITMVDYDNFDENACDFFPFAKNKTVDNTVRQLMNGSISFDDKGASFLPFQVELTHELIHVLHNTQGSNARNVPMPEHEMSLWGSYEEYLTVKGGDPCEAQFCEAHGARARNSHAAQGSGILFNPEERTPTASIKKLTQEFAPAQPAPDSFKDKYIAQMSDIIADQQNHEIPRKSN